MFTVKINHKDIGLTEYPIYSKEEALEQKLDFKHWQKALEGEYALTDDGYVAKVIKRKEYEDKETKRISLYYRMPFGYIMWNPKYPDKQFNCGGREANNTMSGKKWLEVISKSDKYRALATWAAISEDRDVAIDQVFGPVSVSKRRKLRRHMRTETFRTMKREESQKLLADNFMDATYFVELMKQGINIAVEKKDVNGIRGFVSDGMEIHGMKDKEIVKTTEKLEAVQTRKLIDNINQEEERLIATRTTEEPTDD
jgi:hypothetical protein